MCQWGTFRYKRCKHGVVEIREPCRKQLFQAGLTGVLTHCLPPVFTKLRFKPGQWFEGEEPPHPFKYIGQDGYCEFCYRQDKVSRHNQSQSSLSLSKAFYSQSSDLPTSTSPTQTSGCQFTSLSLGLAHSITSGHTRARSLVSWASTAPMRTWI